MNNCYQGPFKQYLVEKLDCSIRSRFFFKDSCDISLFPDIWHFTFVKREVEQVI